MSPAFSEIFELSVPDRLRLVEELWDSIAATPHSLPLLDWQKQELDRRKEAQAQSGAPGASWEDVERRIRERHAP
jgi:putative addiction module component (TIGR02574 family)